MKKGWSFCIVTAPGNELVLNECLTKILTECSGVENYEIIVVGNVAIDSHLKTEKITQLSFNEDFFSPSLSKKAIKRAIKATSLKHLFYRTGAISHKKNMAANHAIYDKLCLLHDYVGLEPGWLTGYEHFGDKWDVCMNVILNKDNLRNRDWIAWDHPYVTDSSNGEGACLIPYDKYTPYMYISGTYFCAKNEFYRANPFDESKFWGDGEDVEWSLRMRSKTRFQMNDKSVVKFLKLKSVKGAPNRKSWKDNGALMLEYFEKNK